MRARHGCPVSQMQYGRVQGETFNTVRLHTRRTSRLTTKMCLEELCDKTTSPCRHARQTPPALHPLPETTHRPPLQASPGPRHVSHLRSDETRSMHMRDRWCLALPALRPRNQGCRLRISRVSFHPFLPIFVLHPSSSAREPHRKTAKPRMTQGTHRRGEQEKH